MFLRCKLRRKDHRYWSIVENRRVFGGRVVQRHVLHLGEINGHQEASWRRTIDLLAAEEAGTPRPAALFPQEYLLAKPSIPVIEVIGIDLARMRLERPRQWGACWRAGELWAQLGLDSFWQEKLPTGRQGARWDAILQILVTYRLNRDETRRAQALLTERGIGRIPQSGATRERRTSSHKQQFTNGSLTDPSSKDRRRFRDIRVKVHAGQTTR